MIRLEGDTLPQESRGKIVPYLFGDIVYDVQGIPLQVGFSATLATNCGIDDVVPVATLLLSGPNIQEIIRAIPGSGVVQIDSEWMQYIGKSISPPSINIGLRGLGTTEITAHSKGATVYFVEGRPLYVFAEAPPGYSYPAGAVVEVRINDNSQVPFHTVRLQDTRIVADNHRFITVEFDLTRSFGAPASNPLPGTVVIQGGSDADEPLCGYLKCVFAIPISGGGIGPIHQYGSSSSFTTARFGTSSTGLKPLIEPLMPPPPPPIAAPAPPPPAAIAAKTIGGEPTITETARFLQLPLGIVTADIKGLLDTPSGRITGAPFQPLVRPAHVTRVCLEQTYGQDDISQFRLSTWNEAVEKQTTLDYSWRLVWEGDSFESFRLNVGICGQAELYIDDDGRWCYHFRDPQTAAVQTIILRELQNEPVLGWTSGSDVTTVLETSWGFGLKAGAFTLESAGMIKRYGRVSPKALNLPYAATEQIARRLARYWLSQWDHQKLQSNVAAAPALLALTRTDRVFIESSLMQLYGEHRIPFEIRGTVDRGVQRTFSLIEADPLTLQAILYGTLSQAFTQGAVLFGTLTPTVFATLYGSIDRPAGDFFGGAYFGSSYFGEGYFR